MTPLRKESLIAVAQRMQRFAAFSGKNQRFTAQKAFFALWMLRVPTCTTSGTRAVNGFLQWSLWMLSENLGD
ncbi:hypothetical protein GW781_13305 [bacterium]|nr:hypothetical protein [bacterium]NCT22115.1 hypothetical protein [bacterium]